MKKLNFLICTMLIALCMCSGCSKHINNPNSVCGTIINVHRPTTAATALGIYDIKIKNDTIKVYAKRGLNFGDTVCEWITY